MKPNNLYSNKYSAIIITAKRKISKVIRSALFWIVIIDLILFLIITVASRISIWPPDLSYKGFHNFILYYDFPIKLLVFSVTATGIVIAYKAYKQTIELFHLENRPWVTIGNKIRITKEKDNNTYIHFDFINTGKTPALNISSEISVSSNSKSFDIPDFVKTEISIPASGEITKYAEMKSKYLNKKEPIIKIVSCITYFDSIKQKHTTKGEYAYNFTTGENTNFGEVYT